MAAKKGRRRGRKKASRKAAQEADAEAFASGVVRRGEAVKKAGRKTKLPPGVTHEIVGEEPGGAPKLRRRRFSAR